VDFLKKKSKKGFEGVSAHLKRGEFVVFFMAIFGTRAMGLEKRGRGKRTSGEEPIMALFRREDSKRDKQRRNAGQLGAWVLTFTIGHSPNRGKPGDYKSENSNARAGESSKRLCFFSVPGGAQEGSNKAGKGRTPQTTRGRPYRRSCREEERPRATGDQNKPPTVACSYLRAEAVATGNRMRGNLEL